MTAIWVGMDSGKWAHHCVVIDAAGRVLLSRRVANDEAALSGLIAAVAALAEQDEAVWGHRSQRRRGGVAVGVAGRPGAARALPSRPDRSPRRGDLPGRRQDRREGRTDHRRSGPDADRSATGPRRRPDQCRSAAADLATHGHDLRPGPPYQPAAGHHAGVLPRPWKQLSTSRKRRP